MSGDERFAFRMLGRCDYNQLMKQPRSDVWRVNVVVPNCETSREE